MTYNEILEIAESGKEIFCQSFNDYVATWYEDGDVQYQVQYVHGEPVSVQEVGKIKVYS